MTYPASVYPLCLVTDRALLGRRSLTEVVAAACRGGVTMVQLREKTAPTRAMVEDARALKALLAGTGVPLIVNDRVDVALAVDADGVHVGQTDMAVADVRRLLGPGKLIGLSITQEDQIRAPDAGEADYLGIGPVHPQQTKSDASAPLGIGGFGRLRGLTGRPVLAIGGVKARDAALLKAEGADGLAVVSAILAADDPREAAAAIAGAWAAG